MISDVCDICIFVEHHSGKVTNILKQRAERAIYLPLKFIQASANRNGSLPKLTSLPFPHTPSEKFGIKS